MAAQHSQGRFPHNEIISLLDVNRRFNLAESTAQDLTLGELLDLAGETSIRNLRLGYATSAGDPTLRAAIAGANGVHQDDVITTQGTALGLFLLALELCRPGDEAVLVTPCFPPSRDALIGIGASVTDVPLDFDNGFRLDIARIEPALSSRTRLVSLASPQNPSGITTPLSAIRQLLELMARKAPDAFLFVDETYREAVYGDNEPTPSAGSIDRRVITGSSISKALGAPGLRTGWLTVRDPDLCTRVVTAKLNTVISGSVLDEALAAVLLHNRQRVLAPRRVLMSTALQLLDAWCAAEADHIEWVRPDAGALCCMRLRSDAFSESAVDRFWTSLPDHDLQLAEGDWFTTSRRTFRLGFGYLPTELLPSALVALSHVLETTRDTR